MAGQNGHHCPRCIGGTLVRDLTPWYDEGYCINCSYRVYDKPRKLRIPKSQRSAEQNQAISEGMKRYLEGKV